MEEEEGKERRETWGWPMEGLDSEVAARKGGGTQKGSDSGKINPPPKTRYDKGDPLHWRGGGTTPSRCTQSCALAQRFPSEPALHHLWCHDRQKIEKRNKR